MESKIEAVLSKFEQDIDTVSDKLDSLLSPPSLDSVSADAPDDQKAVPYALGAYALSSALFAYLRSEGKDTAVVVPELARVKTHMDSLNKRSAEVREQLDQSLTNQPQGKHTRFDDVPKKKKKKSKKKSENV